MQATADTPVKITPELLDQYFSFEKEHRQLVEAWLVKKQGQASVMSLGLELEPKVEELRHKWKLTNADQSAVDGMLGSIVTTRQLWEKTGKAQLAAFEKQQGQPLPALPVLPANATPEQKKMFDGIAALQKNASQGLDGTLVRLRRMRDLTDLRERYGDAAVDYALKNGGDLMTTFGSWFVVAKQKATPKK
jgi:hypothetical protein